MSNNSGQSYKDPIYDAIEAKLEKKYGLPAGGMRDIRTKGERSNANQVSPVGARTVYQIMPTTRDLFRNKYKVDAFASKEAAAEVAALHLRDSMKRNNGSFRLAVREYHGGTDRKQWGPVNRAYDQRVNGGATPDKAGGRYSETVGNTTITTTQLKDIPVDELFHSTPDELFTGSRRGVGPAPRAAKLPTKKEIVTDALTGGDGINIGPVDDTAVQTEKVQEAELVAEKKETDSFTSWDRFEAGMDETLIGVIVKNLSEQDQEFDPSFMRTYRKDWKNIESFATNEEEVSYLREATSQQHLDAIKLDIEDDRLRARKIASAASPTGLMIGTGILDPVGWVAGLGVGKGLQIAGAGSRALITAGRPAAALASGAAEGAIGNLAFTAGLDASGEYVDASEYAMSGLTGLAIGGLLTLPQVGLARNNQVTEQLENAANDRRLHMEEETRIATEQLGPDATPEAVAEVVRERHVKDIADTLDYVLADIPAEQRLMVSEEILTENEAFKQSIIDKADLESVSDVTERTMVAEAIARAEQVDGAITIDKKALQTILARVGQESTAARLLQSPSPVARAVALTLLESAQGAGGRRRTAAIAMAQRERIYVQHFTDYDKQMDLFRKQEGISRGVDFWDGRSRNEFNKRVFREIERRGDSTRVRPDDSAQVNSAADLFENGMDIMRVEQQRVGTVGAARLGDHSTGYAPHRLDPQAVKLLHAPENRTQLRGVRAILSSQFQMNEGFDAAFSDTLASKYLERAMGAANGSYAVPFNLHSPEAGQIVRDALEGMNLGRDDVEKLMGKYSRGGASHTKKRLKLDLDADIGNGQTLMDLFVTDIPTLYRSYARRVSGEVALAQYGVMGKKGLGILRKAAEATGASAKEMESFDQVAAEFLNTSFGTRNHAWMDTLRAATSGSRLGGMGFTQFAEFGNAIPALGIQAAMKGVSSLPRLIAEVRAMALGGGAPNPILQSLDRMVGDVGMDDFYTTRMFDVKDNAVDVYGSESMGVITRAIRGGAHANMILSGHRMILAVQTRAMSEQIIRKAVRFARSGGSDAALDDMGINATLRDAIRKDLDKIATFDSKGELLSLDMMKGTALKPHMVAELTQSIERGASQIIQRTYTGETGAWAHDGFLKLLFQFRTFSLTSVEKQWGRNSMNYGAMKSFMYLMGAASFAAPIHLARTQLKMIGMEDGKKEEYWENNSNPLALSRATLNYASSSGLAGDIMDVGVGFASNYGGDFGEKFGDAYSPRGKRSDQLIGGVAAPGAGLAQDVYQGVTTGDAKKLIRSLPGSNLPYVSPFITAALADD